MITRRNYLLNSVLQALMSIFTFFGLSGQSVTLRLGEFDNKWNFPSSELDESVTTINEHLTRYLKLAQLKDPLETEMSTASAYKFITLFRTSPPAKIMQDYIQPMPSQAVSVHQYVSGAREAFLSEGLTQKFIAWDLLEIIQEKAMPYYFARVKCSKKVFQRIGEDGKMDYSFDQGEIIELIFTLRLKKGDPDDIKIYSILSKKADPEYYSMLEKQEYREEVVASNPSNPRPVKQKQVTEEDNEDLTMQKEKLAEELNKKRMEQAEEEKKIIEELEAEKARIVKEEAYRKMIQEEKVKQQKEEEQKRMSELEEERKRAKEEEQRRLEELELEKSRVAEEKRKVQEAQEELAQMKQEQEILKQKIEKEKLEKAARELEAERLKKEALELENKRMEEELAQQKREAEKIALQAQKEKEKLEKEKLRMESDKLRLEQERIQIEEQKKHLAEQKKVEAERQALLNQKNKIEEEKRALELEASRLNEEKSNLKSNIKDQRESNANVEQNSVTQKEINSKDKDFENETYYAKLEEEKKQKMLKEQKFEEESDESSEEDLRKLIEEKIASEKRKIEEENKLSSKAIESKIPNNKEENIGTKDENTGEDNGSVSNSEQPKFEKQELEGENEKSNKTTNFKNNKSKDSRRQVKKETIAKRKNRDVASKNVEKKQNKGNHKQSTQPQEVIPTKADTSGLVIAQAKIDPEIPDQIRLEIMDQLQLLIQMYRKKAGYHDEETGAFSEDYMNFMDRYYSGETVLYNDMDEVPQDLHMEHINYRDRIYSNMSSSGLRFSLFEMKLISVYSDPLDKYHYKAEIHFKKQMFNMIRNNVNVVDAPGERVFSMKMTVNIPKDAVKEMTIIRVDNQFFTCSPERVTKQLDIYLSGMYQILKPKFQNLVVLQNVNNSSLNVNDPSNIHVSSQDHSYNLDQYFELNSKLPPIGIGISWRSNGWLPKKNCNKLIFIVLGLSITYQTFGLSLKDRFEYKYIEVESQIASDDKPYKKEYQRIVDIQSVEESYRLIQTGLDIGLQYRIMKKYRSSAFVSCGVRPYYQYINNSKVSNYAVNYDAELPYGEFGYLSSLKEKSNYDDVENFDFYSLNPKTSNPIYGSAMGILSLGLYGAVDFQKNFKKWENLGFYTGVFAETTVYSNSLDQSISSESKKPLNFSQSNGEPVLHSSLKSIKNMSIGLKIGMTYKLN